MTDLYYETISVKASPSERDDIYWENPNGPSSSRTWKKCRILLKRQSVSSKQLKATVGRKNVISQATVKATEATVGWLRAGLLTSKNKIFCSKEAQVQDFYWMFFSFWALYCAFPVAPLIPRVIWKIKKRQRHDHSPALCWPRRFWLTDLVQMVISLWSSSWTAWTWSSSPAARYSADLESLHLMTLLLLGWVALGDTDPYIYRDPDTMWKSIVQMEKVFLIGSTKLTDTTLLPKVFLSI